MNYRQLGRTGIQVSEIGFGAWGIGGAMRGSISYGPTDDQESRAALNRAFEKGITFYDTADLYGYGHSERLIGETFQSKRDQVVIASKVGRLNQDGAQDFSPVHVRRSLDESLKRLETDYLDLYQLHDPPIKLLEDAPEICETLRSLKEAGAIRAWGISLKEPADGVAAITKFRCDAVQVNFNMIDQRIIAVGLLQCCREEGVGLVSRTPLCFGFLTGVYSAATQFDSQDHRSRWSLQQKGLWANANRAFASLSRHPGESLAQQALRYCLSYSEVSTVIPGMLRPQEVDENAEASRFGPFESCERESIEGIYKGANFFVKQ
jgi:aryl-alcohol dehydrogenase-like predicted oxidoreductase